MKAVIAIAATLLALPAWAEDCSLPTPRMSYQESSAIKRAMLPPGTAMTDWILDHKMPLCAGGSNDRSNLQLQRPEDSYRKDADEIRVCQGLRAGTMTCAEATKAMLEWRP